MSDQSDCFSSHDFFQVIDAGCCVVTHSSESKPQPPPRFICRKCGKVIELGPVTPFSERSTARSNWPT